MDILLSNGQIIPEYNFPQYENFINNYFFLYQITEYAFLEGMHEDH